MRKLMLVTAAFMTLAWSNAAFAVVDETADVPATNNGKPIQEGELKIKTESGKVIAEGHIRHGKVHKLHVHNDEPKASRDDKVVIEIYDKKTDKTYDHDKVLAAVLNSGIDASTGGPAARPAAVPAKPAPSTANVAPPLLPPALTPGTAPERKIRLSFIGGGAYLYSIDVNSSSGFYSGNTQGGAVGTLWGGSAFIDLFRVPVPLLGSPMLSVGVVADQTDGQLQFTGRCGGEPCTGTNGSVSETAVIGELNLAFPFGGGNVYNWYAGGGVVFKTPRGNPTGPGGPGITGTDTAPAVRIGGTLMHNFTDNLSAGVKVGFQWAGSTSYDTTLPGERFRFGRESEMIFAAVATYSIPVGGSPGP